MRILIVLFLVLSSFISFAQPESAVKVKVDGVSYYQHTVQAGNTIYGLHEVYGVSVEEIVKLNPELQKGLKVGQRILIPIIVEPSVETVKYKVKRKETLYGLSKKFNVSIDALILLNPSLKDGLKKGHVILVPKSQVQDVDEVSKDEESSNPFVVDTIVEDGFVEEVTVSFEDSIIEHVVAEGETMYSVSKRFMVSVEELMKVNGLKTTTVHAGQILVIPLKKEKVEKVVIKSVSKTYDLSGLDSLSFIDKEVYNIAILLPFHLDQGRKHSKYVSNLSTQFYMGAKLAIDSLRYLGLNAKIHVFDTKSDSLTIVKLLQKSVFDDVDLIIGPLLSDEVHQVADFCKKNKIRMVCPVSVDQDVLEGNRLVYSAVPSNVTLVQGMAEFLTNESSLDRIIVVKPSDKLSLPYYSAFVNAYKLVQNEKSPALIETTVSDFSIHIQKKNKTHIVIPTIDKAVAMKFVNDLNKTSFKSRLGDVQVYGMKEWVKFKEINSVYKNKYHLHFAGSNYLNYNEENTVELNKKYRSIYVTDLPKMAVQGYDVTLFYISKLLLGQTDLPLIMNDFEMVQISSRDGWKNVHFYVVKQDNFELIKIK